MTLEEEKQNDFNCDVVCILLFNIHFLVRIVNFFDNT